MLAQTETGSRLIPPIPVGQWVENLINFLQNRFGIVFDFVSVVSSFLINLMVTILTLLPALPMAVALAAIAWLIAGWRVGVLAALGFLLIISLGFWEESMQTLALVLAATMTAVLISVPLGILAAKSRIVEIIVTPMMDLMQTMPPFAYLIPALVLFSLGVVPALFATVIFALPPGVRLTLLGIHQVPKETVEAAQAFGATTWQTLGKVELPQAVASIMAGVNQVIMLSLSMVVIAALIGAGGLGAEVVAGLSTLDIPLGVNSGLSIVVIAIVLDRITRNAGRRGGGAKSKS